MIKDVFTLEEKDFQSLNAKGFGKKNSQFYELETFEVLYLVEKNKIQVYNTNELLTFETIFKKTKTTFQNYTVYKDLKIKGYQVKSGLKYGFTFRIYDKGIKQGEDHSLWLVEPILEKNKILIKDLAGKNRIAHSTKKKMLFAIIDTDDNITYLETNWKRL